MVKFVKKVDKRSREAMVKFLEEHFRYDTMNSWNQKTSYANNVKIDRLGLTHEQVDKLLDMIACEDAYDVANGLIREFGAAHNWEWQAGFNGRSGGYLVLYQGGWKPDEHKSYCTKCGQKNFTSVKETGCKCGRCGAAARVDFKTPPKQIFSYPGKSTDMNEDFEDWSMRQLRERVDLVTEFDQLCDDIVASAVKLSEQEIIEEVVYEPKVIRRIG